MMNHRRALQTSTDVGLLIFFIAIAGIVIRIVDEALGWNLLPDWIDKFAEVIVTILAILAAFSVVISIMCSFAVIAEAKAEQAGLSLPAPTHWLKLAFALGIPLVFVILFGLNILDDYRANQRAKLIQEQMPKVTSLFSPDMVRSLRCDAQQPTDEDVSKLLHAIRVSTIYRPSVYILAPAQKPYTHCIITALTTRHKSGKIEYLHRQFLTDFPSEWERNAVKAGFAGQEIVVPASARGIFFNTSSPSGWGSLKDGSSVAGMVILRGRK